jgi:hypothetical protein
MALRLTDQFPARRLTGASVALLAELSLSGCPGVQRGTAETFGEGEYDVAVKCPPGYDENIETVDLVQVDAAEITIDCRAHGSSRPPLSIKQVHPPLTANNIVTIGYYYGEYGKQEPLIGIDPSDGAVATISFSDISGVEYADQNRALQN